MSVDILLPYYGDVALMKLAVQSVRWQTVTDWRLIVMDDGYPDPTIPGWFESLHDSRICYERNETNLGANANYRKCLTRVERDLVVVMGADDVMMPTYLEWLRDRAERHPEAAVFQPGVFVIDQHGAPSHTLVERVKARYRPGGRGVRQLQEEKLATSILRGDWLYFPSLGWRAETITGIGFREGYDVVQDVALLMDVAYSGKSLLVDDVATFLYRRHSGSDSSWRALEGTRFAEERRFFAQIAHEMDERDWQTAARAARLHLSSRLHAGSLLPRAVLAKKWSGVKNLGAHMVA